MSRSDQANFRIGADNADWFRDFCVEKGINQSQGFELIRNATELFYAKNNIADRKTEIENFEMHLRALLSGYLNSLELAQDSEERSKELFRTSLESKDTQILDLQEQNIVCKENMTAAEAKLQEETKQREYWENTFLEAKDRIHEMETQVEDKKTMSDFLSVKIKDAEDKVEEYPRLREQIDELQKTLAAKDAERMQMDAEHTKQVTAFEREVDKAQAEKAQAVILADNNSLKTIVALEKEKGAEINKLRDIIDQLKEEKAALRDELMAVKQKCSSDISE